MNKHEIIRKIYGENPSFSYDTALPQRVLDNIADEAVMDWHKRFTNIGVGDEEKAEYRRRVYETIRMGCVYAYDKNGHGEGLLALTNTARFELRISQSANMIYVPVIQEID
jgi:hypothetical protein